MLPAGLSGHPIELIGDSAKGFDLALFSNAILLAVVTTLKNTLFSTTDNQQTTTRPNIKLPYISKYYSNVSISG